MKFMDRYFLGRLVLLWKNLMYQNDPNHVIIDFKESRVSDMSAIEALNNLTKKYNQVNKIVELKHLSDDCRHITKKCRCCYQGKCYRRPYL